MNEPLREYPAILGPPCDPPEETAASLRDHIAYYDAGIARAEKRLDAEHDPAERKLIAKGLELTKQRRHELAAQLRAAEEQEGKRNMLRADEHGFTLSRNVLKALLAFAATEDAAERLDVVSVAVTGKAVTARASDGHSAVTFTGMVDHAPAGAWDLVLPFLRFCAKALSGNDEIRIEPHGATVRNATVFRQAENGEAFEEAEQIVFTYDAARRQKAFPWEKLSRALKRPREGASGVSFDADLMARIALVQKASGSRHCTMHLGENAVSPIVLECGEDATALIMPMTSTPGSGGKKGKGKKDGEETVEQAVLEFVRVLEEHGATATIETPGGEPVTVGGRGKGRKD